MRKKNKSGMETLKFLRSYFQIPKNKKISWGIIEETAKGETKYRLGVLFPNSKLYLDVARRRFFTETDSAVNNCDITRRIYPAKRKCYGYAYYFTNKEKNICVEYSKRFIADVYYFALYSKELENDIVY